MDRQGPRFPPACDRISGHDRASRVEGRPQHSFGCLTLRLKTVQPDPTRGPERAVQQILADDHKTFAEWLDASEFLC
jgi:hypothetical protein